MEPAPLERPPIASVEQVREELRKLGYLDSGLGRFVLAGGGGSLVGASLRASGRVGIAGGLLFGLAATLAAVGLDRRLLGDGQDLAVLTLYLVLGCGIATGLAALLAGLVAARMARRAARRPSATLARNAGLAAAALGITYSAIWWRSHLQGAPLGIQVGALTITLALALALGRFVSLAAVAVLAAAGLSDELPQAGLTRPSLLPPIALAIAVYGATIATAAWHDRPRVAPDFAVVPTALRLRVIAVDGLQYAMARDLAAAGEMPNLAAMMATGAHGRLRAEPERVPAIVWTTIATGRGPAAHGIDAPDARRVVGLRTAVSVGADGPFASALARATDLLRLTEATPPSGILRGAKTFWNVASEKGLRVDVVNWWATWPAEPINGRLVTDRALIRLERGGPQDRDVHPAELFGVIAALPRPPSANRGELIDRFAVDAALALRARGGADVEVVYLPGLDILSEQQLSGSAVSDLASLEARLAAVRGYHKRLDDLVGELIAGLPTGGVALLAADPGRLARAGSQDLDGLFVMSGSAIREVELPTVLEKEIAPTVLYLLGVPRSRELEGQIVLAAFDPAFVIAHPPREVATYGARATVRSAESAFDKEVLEELRSLGYVR
jgi:hypothetical protein